MASPHVYTSTKDLLQTRYHATYPVLDFDEIETAVTKAGDTPWLALEEIGGAYEDVAAFGDPQNICQREQGVILVHAFVPAPTTIATGLPSSFQARDLVADIQDYMRMRRYSGIRIVEVSSERSSFNHGLWSSSTAALSYEFDFHTAVPPSIP